MIRISKSRFGPIFLKRVILLLKKILIAIVRFYQREISPVFPACCRFQPTCSQYAIEAIEKHGPWKGLGLAVWRILRCNPLCKGGYDPVP